MKKVNYIRIKRGFLNLLITAIIGYSVVTSCANEPDLIRTTSQETVGSFLEKNPQRFSEFIRLLDTTKVMGLVKAYGTYTMFAPTDSAMRSFYKEKGRSSMQDFSLDTLKKIAYDHIIKGFQIASSTDSATSQVSVFQLGLMPYLTMSDRYLSISVDSLKGNIVYYVNGGSAILSKDNFESNGIVHVINKVLNPTENNLVQMIGKNKRFSLFYEALKLTGLDTKLTKIYDLSYDPKNYKGTGVGADQGSGSKDELPTSRKYGYTAFMESDDTYHKYGIYSLEDLKKYAAANVYYEPGQSDVSGVYTDTLNSLYRFIGYHLVNKKLSSHQLIDAYDNDNMLKTFDMYEYVETMCPNTLFEVKKVRISGETNLINVISATGEAIRIIAPDSDATNGVYHEIDRIMIYDSKVASEMSSKRLRMDAASFFPEITNNNMRYFDVNKPRSWVFPQNYIERLTCSSTTDFCYLNAFGGYLDYQGDEIYLKGMYDFEMITPPVPAGTYEVRFCYQPTAKRGAAQLYWDGVPCGIPLDLRILADDPLIGYVKPGSNTEDFGYDSSGAKIFGVENDKMMRNRGYMKGPCTYCDPLQWWYKAIARDSHSVLRRILGTYTFPKAACHRFKVKAVREGQFMMDYLEFVPVEILETEGID
jgi:uncharacterized surface protein with fasciclin (FAS1) repeats